MTSVVHTELLRLLARRGELTEALEQTDLAIARYRGMFDLEQAVNLPAPAPQPGRGGQGSEAPTRSREAPDSTSGAPREGREASEERLRHDSGEKPMRPGAGA